MSILKRAAAFLFFLSLMSLSSCCYDTDDDDGGGGPPPGPSGTTLSGTVYKGPVSGGNIEVLSVFDNGAPGIVVGSGTTNSAGGFELDVGDYRGYALITVRGGTYVSEATGESETVPQNFPMLAIVNIDSETVEGAIVSPLTTLSAILATDAARSALVDIDLATMNADISVGRFFGGVDVHALPTPLDTPNLQAGPGVDAALVIGAISEIALSADATDMEYVHYLGMDMLDYSISDQNFELPSDFGLRAFNILQEHSLPANITTIIDAMQNRPQGVVDEPLDVVAIKGSSTLPTGGGFTKVRFDNLGSAMDPLQIRIESTLAEVSISSFDDLGIDFATFANPMLPAGVYDMRFIRTETGHETIVPNVFRVIDPMAAPAIGTISPREVSTAGGDVVRVHWASAIGATEARIDGVPAEIASINGGVWLDVIVPAGNGAGTITLQNDGPAATMTNALTRRDYDLGRSIGIDYARPFEITGVSQGFEGSAPFTRIFHETVTPSGTDSGTFSRDVTEYLTGGILTDTTTSGSSFLMNQAGFFGVLNGAAQEQRFHLLGAAGGGGAGPVLMSGLHAGGRTYAYQTPSGTTSPGHLAGEWFVAGILQDFSGGAARYGTAYGSLILDAQGRGGVNMKGRVHDAIGGSETLHFAQSLTAMTSGKGVVLDMTGGTSPFGGTWTVIPNSDRSVLDVRVSDTPGFAASYMAFRPQVGLTAEAADGAYVGGLLGKDKEDGDFEFSYDFRREQITTGIAGGVSLRYNEFTRGVSALDPDGEFREKGRLSTKVYAGVDGSVYNGGRRIGYVAPSLGVFLRTDDYGLLVSKPKLEITPVITGPKRYISFSFAPTIEGFTRFETKSVTTDILRTAEVPGGGALTIAGINARRERAVGGGSPFFADLSFMSNLFTSRSAVRGRSDLLISLRPQILDPDEDHLVYPTVPTIDGEESESLEMEARGAVSANGAVAALRDSGEGDASEIRVLLDGFFGDLPISGEYHAGGQFYEFDAETGELTAEAARGTVTLNSPGPGQFTYELSFRRENSGGVQNELSSGPGTFVLEGDGKVLLTVEGEEPLIFSGGATSDGDLLVLVDQSVGTRSGILVLVRKSEGAPTIRSMTGISLEFRFLDLLANPATFAVSSGERMLTQGLGQVNLSGVIRERTSAGGPPALQQLFAVAGTSVTADGTFTVTVGAESRVGGLSPGGDYGFVIPGTNDPTRIALDLLFAR